MNREKGDNAFPISPEGYDPEWGISVRDYFAAKAMQAIIAKIPLFAENADSEDVLLAIKSNRAMKIEVMTEVVTGAYNYADAMLVCREMTNKKAE